jgi:hypothetical protein
MAEAHKVNVCDDTSTVPSQRVTPYTTTNTCTYIRLPYEFEHFTPWVRPTELLDGAVVG